MEKQENQQALDSSDWYFHSPSDFCQHTLMVQRMLPGAGYPQRELSTITRYTNTTIIRFIIETTPLPSHCIDSCRYTITFMKNSESRNCRSHNSDHTKPRMRSPPLLMLCFPLLANALLMPLSSHCYPVLLSQLDNTMPGEYLDQNREVPVSLVSVHANILNRLCHHWHSLCYYTMTIPNKGWGHLLCS